MPTIPRKNWTMKPRSSVSTIVLDTGPLIALARLDLLVPCRKLFDLTMTKVVYEESQFKKSQFKTGLDARRICDAVSQGQVTIEPLENSANVVCPASLGDGECSSIQLAVQLRCPVVLDDKLARRFAKQKASVVGTIGLLLEAKRRGVVDSVGESLKQLHAQGYYFSGALIARARQLAGEE